MGSAIVPTLILVGMCGLMWGLARIAKRRMGVGSGNITGDAIRVVGKRPLDQKHALWVVEIAGGRHILLGTGTDGAVSKLDDISADEFAAMNEEEAPKAAPKLRLARIAGAATPSTTKGPLVTVKTQAEAAADAGDTTDIDGLDVGDEAEEARFATVSESFQHFLGKARSKRASGE